jgi:epoxyqueuosine reductase QueG
MNPEIEKLLFERGADIVRFVDVSDLPFDQTLGFSKAIVFCMALSKEFIIAVKNGEKTGRDEFVDKEHETDALADWLAEYLIGEGHKAYSQSENSLLESGRYDESKHTTVFPHKTIGRRAGIGFMGKNDLLISEEYGCAFSMCTVLTDAPVETASYPAVPPECGDCRVCKEVCREDAIFGNEWSEATGREGVVDVFKCRCALKCLVNCPKTLKYAYSRTFF